MASPINASFLNAFPNDGILSSVSGLLQSVAGLCHWIGRRVDERGINVYCPKSWRAMASKVNAVALDALIWAAYFARFAQAPMTLFCSIRFVYAMTVQASDKGNDVDSSVQMSSWRRGFYVVSRYVYSTLEEQSWAIAVAIVIMGVAACIFSLSAPSFFQAISYLSYAVLSIPISSIFPQLGKTAAQCTHYLAKTIEPWFFD